MDVSGSHCLGYVSPPVDIIELRPAPFLLAAHVARRLGSIVFLLGISRLSRLALLLF
jgi:hypothetical protein